MSWQIGRDIHARDMSVDDHSLNITKSIVNGDVNANHTHIHIHTNDPKTITEAIQSLSNDKSNGSTETTYTYQIKTSHNGKKRSYSNSITCPNDDNTPNTPNRKKRKLNYNINDIDGIMNCNESSVMSEKCNKLDTIDINNKWNLFNVNNIQKKSNLNSNNNNSMIEQQQTMKSNDVPIINDSHKVNPKSKRKKKRKVYIKSKVACNKHTYPQIKCNDCRKILNERIEALGVLSDDEKQKIKDNKVRVKLCPQKITKYNTKIKQNKQYLICSCYVKLDDNKKEENNVAKNKNDRFYVCEICGKANDESATSRCVLAHLRIYVGCEKKK